MTDVKDAFEIIVDEQLLYIPSASLITQLRCGVLWNGMRAPRLDLLWRRYEQVCHLDQVQFAIGKAGKYSEWYPYFLLNVGTTWQRIECRDASCALCEWQD